MTGLRPDDLDRLAADPSDLRLVKLALRAAAREIAFLRAEAMDRGARPLFPGPEPAPGWLAAGMAGYVGPKAITKTHLDRLIWAGTTAEQAWRTEVACLSRLSQTAAAAHFPTVLAMDPAALSLTLAHVGFDLRHVIRRGRPVAVRDSGAQVARMLAGMAATGIVHLDMHRDGRNLCVSDDGHLTLIDFDIAALDGHVLSGAMAERLAALQATGDVQAALAAQIEDTLSRCELLRRE